MGDNYRVQYVHRHLACQHIYLWDNLKYYKQILESDKIINFYLIFL